MLWKDAHTCLRSWATGWPPLARTSTNSGECDEALVQFNTHVEQLASSMREEGHTVNEAAHQVGWPTALEAHGRCNPSLRQARNVHGFSTRPLTRSRKPTATSTASPATQRSRKIGSTLGSRRVRAPRLETRALPSLSDTAPCTSRTPSPSWKTDARGSAQHANTYRASAHSSSPLCARARSPRWAGKTCRNPERVCVGPHGAPPARAICHS